MPDKYLILPSDNAMIRHSPDTECNLPYWNQVCYVQSVGYNFSYSYPSGENDLETTPTHTRLLTNAPRQQMYTTTSVDFPVAIFFIIFLTTDITTAEERLILVSEHNAKAGQ